MRARGVSPAALAPRLLPISTAAAPSTMPEELPAWWTWVIASTSGCAWVATAAKPPISAIMPKDGFSAASPCMLVDGRMVSSRSRMVMPLTSTTGITDFEKAPAAQLAAARLWLSTA